MKRFPFDVAALVVCLGFQLALAVGTLRYSAATFDEGSHLPAGYSYWATGDFRMNPEHPPLLKLWAALPLLAADVRMDAADPAWQARRQWEFGRRFLYRWNDADRLLFLGRLPIVALGLALTVAVFLWARHLGGPLTGVLAAFLCAASPDVLAHSTVVTTDLGITLFSLGAVVALSRFLEGATARRVAGLAGACALAATSKYSAALLVPILLLLCAVGMRRRGAPSVRQLLMAGAATAVTVYVSLWAVYGFRYASTSDPALTLPWENVLPADASCAARP
jgi:predicted membrane-bound dolichyl-phosphate-mannose-protein mannosyltransferase